MGKKSRFTALIVSAFLVVSFVASAAFGSEPNWSPIVIPQGIYRAQIKSMPIEQRPYRPLHFYGNTVRRSYYRGNPIVMPRDIFMTTSELVRRQ